ncbi:juvenile hormone esterase-like isoform X2 [Bacillus rossius redtenbacheri]|uniref:juvenile hormone esterase-like isoform X2 n=1 Tax=Bacillus rossius redtenbacheri TaxID=93214 RepID=UPI002FDD5A68
MYNLLFSVLLALSMVIRIQGLQYASESNNTVKVSQGYLLGKKVTSEKTGGVFYSFLGIPYAQPPVGDLRFKAPAAAESWTGVRNATFYRSICPQLADVGSVAQGSEDCLYLNVYTPQLPSSSKVNLLPVMVWIHGGGFTSGSGNAPLFNPDYLVGKGVVLVTFNYRLGVLGFLGLNSSVVSRNNALKDQLAALKWVRANIAQFGGDKDHATIFGESAGAASVELQILSPATKGLFRRAISQSGSAIDRWAYTEPSPARQRAFRLGEVLGFASGDEDALSTFLKNVSASKLVESQESALLTEDVLGGITIPFMPTRESGKEAFLPDSPLSILKSGNYQHVPYITGFNSAEGKYFAQNFVHNSSLWTQLLNDMELFVPPELNLPLGSPQSVALAAEIKKMYFGDVTPTVDNIEELVSLYSDAYFVSGVRRSVNIRTRNYTTPLYVYRFSYVGLLSFSQLLQFDYPFRGASHGDDLGYLFGVDGLQLASNSTEMTVLNQMTTMWTNFAKTGNPAEGFASQWDIVSSSKKPYLNIDSALSTSDLDKLQAERFAIPSLLAPGSWK